MTHTFFPKDTPRRRQAFALAKKRGEVASEWMKTKTLTKETEAEFLALMKSVKL